MLTNDAAETPQQVRALICELGRRFYALGWVSGTGGGISIRLGERIFLAPSGVQKEALSEETIFETDLAGKVTAGPPPERGYTVSECQPLFMTAFQQRGAGAVIHSHSRWAVLATLFSDEAFSIRHLEMIKGIAGHGYHDLCQVPIIENTAQERDLTESMSAAIDAWPKAQAVLVRRHGLYVWGRDWREAKRHAECYDYLFATAVEMKRLGIDPAHDAP